MNNISLSGSALKYMSEHIFQSLTTNQMNLIKKIGIVVSLAFGAAVGIYVLYKVSSCLFAKSISNNEEDFDTKDLKINLEKVKKQSSPIKRSPDLSSKKQSPNSDKTPSPFVLPKHSPEISSKMESPKLTKTTPITDNSIQDDDEYVHPTPLSSPQSSKIDPGSQPSEDPGLISSIKSKTQKQIDLEQQFSLLCDEAKSLKPSKSVMHLIVQEFNDKPAKAIELINVALSQGIAVDIVDKCENTPLYYALDIEILHHLIDCGANPNVQNAEGRTPLHNACTIHIVKAHLDRGATVDISDKEGITILEAQIERFLCFPCDTNAKEIVEFLIVKGAKLGVTQNTEKLLKKAFQGAITGEKTSFPIGSSQKAQETCLAISKQLIALGAQIKIVDQELFLERSLKEWIMNHDNNLASKKLFFEISDVLIQFFHNLAFYDPYGRFIKMAFEKIINNHSILLDSHLLKYYLDIVDKLANMGSVRVDVTDFYGRLLNRLISEAIAQDPINNPSFLDPYFEVADKLIELGASFEVSDPSGAFLEDMIEFAASYPEKDWYLSIAKRLLARGCTLNSDQISRLNQNIKAKVCDSLNDCKTLAKQMIEAGLPEEIQIRDKTLAEWKKEI